MYKIYYTVYDVMKRLELYYKRYVYTFGLYIVVVINESDDFMIIYICENHLF